MACSRFDDAWAYSKPWDFSDLWFWSCENKQKSFILFRVLKSKWKYYREMDLMETENITNLESGLSIPGKDLKADFWFSSANTRHKSKKRIKEWDFGNSNRTKPQFCETTTLLYIRFDCWVASSSIFTFYHQENYQAFHLQDELSYL